MLYCKKQEISQESNNVSGHHVTGRLTGPKDETLKKK